MRAPGAAAVIAACLLFGIAPAAGAVDFSPLPGSPYPTTDPPFMPNSGAFLGGLAAGDFNHDGISDIAVSQATGVPAMSPGESVSILLGSPNHGLTPASGQPTAIYSGGIFSGEGAVATDDFNGDENLDLAVVDQAHADVAILLGDGHGSFQLTPAASPFTGYNASLAVGDFNGDGKQDVAVVSSGASTGELTVFLGDGHGGFAQAAGSPIALSSFGSAIAAGDFNEDGRTDLVATTKPDGLTVLLAGPSGEMNPTAKSPLPAGDGPASIAVADLNHDDKLDLAVSDAGDDSATVLLGDGHGGFSAAEHSPFAVPGAAGPGQPGLPEAIAAADFAGDSIPDLAVANWNGFSNNVAILEGDGTGAFTSPPGDLFPAHGNPRPLVVGDFNGDGKPDIAVANSFQGRVTVLANCGDEACPPPEEEIPPGKPEPEPFPYEPLPTKPSSKQPATAIPGDDARSQVQGFTSTSGGGTTSTTPAGPPSIQALFLARHRIRAGQRISLTIQLPQDATIVLELRRLGAGRFRSLGAVTRPGHQGTNALKLQRLHGRALVAGRYLLVVSARARGVASNAKTARLTVTR